MHGSGGGDPTPLVIKKGEPFNDMLVSIVGPVRVALTEAVKPFIGLLKPFTGLLRSLTGLLKPLTYRAVKSYRATDRYLTILVWTE